MDVPPEHVQYVKDQIEHWIDQATEASDSFTSADVWAAIENRTAQLWLAWDELPTACAVTRLYDTTKGKHCGIWLMVGSDRNKWVHLMAELEQWARREGCNMMRHEAPLGWSRILKPHGYDMRHVILTKEL